MKNAQLDKDIFIKRQKICMAKTIHGSRKE